MELHYRTIVGRRPGAGQGNDARLLAAVKSGHSVAFGELFNRYKAENFSPLTTHHANHEDAEDVVQEAFQLALFICTIPRATLDSPPALAHCDQCRSYEAPKKARKAETSIDEHSESDDMSFRDAVTDSAPNPEQDCFAKKDREC